MAQTGYTPIILFNSTTASNVPTTSNLAVGELAINIPDGKLYYNKSGTITVLANANFATSVSTISFGTTGLTPSTATNGVVTVAGTLAIANGGTNATATPTAGAVPYGTGTAYAFTSAGTTGQVLTSNGSSAPTWATPTAQSYPGVGIANSTGSAWGTSYSTTGSGTVVALATSPTFVTPILGTPTSGTLTNTTGFPAANLAGTALPSAIVTSSLTAVGTIATGVWNGTTIAIANGGTGQTTASAGFNALSPITTTGDLIIGNGTNSATRLAIGANTYVLTSNGTTASWVAPSGGGGSQATATALGTVYALQTTGGGTPYLTAFGYQAGVSTTGVSNSAFGTQALYSNTTATNNTAVGYQAGYGNTIGSLNVLVGSGAGYTNTAGYGLTAIGYQAAYSTNLTSAGYTGITAIGVQTLYSNTTGGGNIAIGGTDAANVKPALYTNTTGSYNIGIGTGALSLNTTASNNTAVGYQAGYSGTTFASGSVTAFGYQAAYASTAGRIVAIGERALASTTTGDSNVAVGYLAGYSNNSGTLNTYVGDYAAQGATTGSGNTVIGARAGYLSLTTGANNVLIGYAAGVGTGTDSQSIVIGYGTNGKGTNTGFINPNSGGVYQGNNSAAWSVASDQRLKKNIVDNNVGLEKVIQIQVRNFEYRTENEVNDLPKNQAIAKQGVQLGVIAQELQQVLPDCVKEETTGVLSVNSENITWHLINAVKELSAELNALKLKVGV